MQKLVGRRYELLEQVGSGGQGDVWRAHDRQHRRTVALKVRRVRHGQDRDALLREARLLLGVKPHPGLPLVREDFFEGDSYYIVMDWIEGRNLADVLIEQGSPGLALETAISYLRQVSDALDHLHAHDPPVVHQDVKPANVIVGSDGDVALVDLGISGWSDRAIESAEGTPAYRDPGLLEGAAPTAATDVFGLAATAFCLLVGTPPAPGPRPPLLTVPPAHVGRVWRALDAGLAYDPQRRPSSAGEFVALLEPAASGTNLPVHASAFVGRERDLTALMDSLAGSRLVTLTGAGGLGKTRLALEAAARMAHAYGDGVWLAELGSLRSATMVPGVVASLFGTEEQRGRPIVEGIQNELHGRSALLVLDNCEHVLDACQELVAGILSACPGIDILATSRQALGVEGEFVYDVQPMTLPKPDETEPKTLALSEAVRLFLDRATVVRPGFRMTPETAPLVARICSRLDGMPLAIELAAARTSRLDVSDIAARLDDSTAVLRADSRKVPRHQTLRATFEWSYSLLSPDERRAFTWLSVLSGGFTSDVASELLASDAVPQANVSRTLADLVAKSLIVARADEPGGTRFGMLETARAYAVEKLIERGEERHARTQALRWALVFAEHADRELAGPSRVVWLARVEAERENLRESLTFALDEDKEAALRLACALAEFWAVRGPWSDGRRLLDSALSAQAGPDDLRAKACTGAGQLAFLEADYDVARALHGQALSLRNTLGDDAGAAQSLASLGMVAEARGDFDLARELYGQSLSTYQTLGDATGTAEQLTNLGNVSEYQGDYETAQSLHEESLGQRRALGDQQGVATSLLNLGYVAAYRGDPRGREFLDESLKLYRDLGDRYGASRALNLLAIRAWFDGDGERARTLGEEALRMRKEIGDRLGIAVSIESLGGLAAFQGHGVYAARLFGAAERLRDAIGSPVTPSDQALLDWARSDAQKAAGADAFDAAVARGRELKLEDAIELALTRP